MPSDEELDEYDVRLEDVMTKMAAVREKMFSEVIVNISDAQKRYKKDYDKRKSQAEVNVYAMILITVISPMKIALTFHLYRKCMLVVLSF